jgi:hypothetical protein
VKVVFLAPAQNELDDAVAWENRQAAGSGRELLDELDRGRSARAGFSAIVSRN